MLQRLLPLLVSGLLLFAISGCDSTAPAEQNADIDTASEPAPLTITSQVTTDTPPPLLISKVIVCKIAPDDPNVLFDFEASVTGPGADRGILYPTRTLSDQQCDVVYAAPRDVVEGPDDVTITEMLPDGWMLDRVEIFTADVVDGQEVITQTTENTATVSASVIGLERGVTAVYYNSPGEVVIIGGEGCTPGAWKNRLLRVDRWPVSPDTPVGDVWSAAPAELADATLLEALSFRGGSSFNDKVQILLRAATAAYLNSLSVDYDLTTQQIIDGGNAAIASGDKDTVIDLAETLDGFNNQDCPITER